MARYSIHRKVLLALSLDSYILQLNSVGVGDLKLLDFVVAITKNHNETFGNHRNIWNTFVQGI